MVEEQQQQLIQIERKIIQKKLDLDILEYEWGYGGKWRHRSSELDRKKMEFDILTFTHSAYRDKKAILSFSSGEPEVNIHNLSYRILHEARSMRAERHLLNMIDPDKHSDSGFSLEELDQQIWRLDHDLLMEWRHGSIIDREKNRKKLVELVKERDQLFGNSPIKGSLWSSLPSMTDLQNQIQALETIEDEKRKVVSQIRKKIESNKKELKKAENEIKSLRKTMTRIRQKKKKEKSFINSSTP